MRRHTSRTHASGRSAKLFSMSSSGPFLILGCGYTGRRAARRLLTRGFEVWATARGSLELPGVRVVPFDLDNRQSIEELGRLVPSGIAVLHSVPVLPGPAEATRAILHALGSKPRRIVYLSTTGVYGAKCEVDEHTPPAPLTESSRLRVQAEQLVLQGRWSGMVLRPAAIYGPGRGAHVSIPRGTFHLAGDGMNFVSRIHVDDLAALAEAALLTNVTGGWPVADEEPARSREMAEFVCDLLSCPMPQSIAMEELHETRRADRRVDGRAVCRLLDVRLQYPSYRVGIPASL
ncbi:NAD-dependent epimerase/dehydratase family protein [uncultured Paludibaculum sp.]|uniref:NAD-dependent epimerase/dehydratase family protein n=1 Tax=uncultured Paludibaculum sp. TaxID=1765020 RepID=UPI002AAAD7D8|nr:NAD-dependent epimerase/dehydratase family protein [uncultured Paludibaculum sp.]